MPSHRPDRPAVRRPRRRPALVVFALLVGLAVSGRPAAAQRGADPPAPGRTALTYRLAGTWTDVAYGGDQALFAEPLDVAAAPDGRVIVLDRGAVEAGPGPQLRPLGAVVRVLDADGRPLRAISLAPSGLWPLRLDAGYDGGAAVLGNGDDNAKTLVLPIRPDATTAPAFEVSRAAVDVAVGPDGRIAVADVRKVTLYAPDGRLTAVIDPGALDRLGGALPPPPANAAWSVELLNVDIAADGRIYVHVKAKCSGISREPTPTPSVTPTARPRLAHAAAAPTRVASVSGAPVGVDDAGPRWASGEGPRPLALQQGVTLDERAVVLVYDPRLALVETIQGREWIMDIAVNAGPLYGSLVRGIDRPVHDLRQLPLGRVAAMPLQTSQSGGPLPTVPVAMPLRLAVTADGRILGATVDWDHWYRGVVDFGAPIASGAAAAVRPRTLGPYARPAPVGPLRPLAVSAGAAGIVVEQAPFAQYPDESGVRTAVSDAWAIAGLQRWTPDGRLVDQWAHRASAPRYLGTEALAVYGVPVDIAAAGDAVYAITPGAVWRRVDRLAGEWVYRFTDGQLVAGDADAEHVAVIDAAARAVHVLGADGRLERSWPINEPDGPAWAPADIALGGGQVFLADQGRNRIIVADLDGAHRREWATHDGPERIDATDDGDVIVLGRGGWGLRYGADGALLAAWRLPGAAQIKDEHGTDVAVDDEGRVYVTWLGAVAHADDDRRGDRVDRAGVWVFEPAPSDEAPSPPDLAGCLVNVDKKAAPGRLRLGGLVEVALTVNGECPREPVPQQIVIVLDTSWSMNDGYLSWTEPPSALDRGRAILLPLLAALSPDVVDLGLVTFGDGAALATPLSDDLADMRRRIVVATADGDTRMGAGVDLARTELLGPRRNPQARPTILIVSDGVFKDDPAPAIAAARADGIGVYGLILSTPEFTAAYRASLTRLLGADRLFVDPSVDTSREVIDAITAFRDVPYVFRTLTVRDEVPANMDYVAGSAVPPAIWDAAARTLTWTLTEPPAGRPVRLSFWLRPRQVGTWPTNVVADARWRDAREADGRAVFPIPIVEVLPSPVYLPFASRQVCVAWTRPIDLVLVQDVSSSMSQRAADGRRTKLAVAVEAAAAFLDRLNTFRDRVAVVAFDADARVVAPLSNDFAAAAAGLAALEPGRGTRIEQGLSAAAAILGQNARALALPVVVLLSDGLQNGSADPVRAVLPELRAIGARVFAVGYGQAVDEALLREIALDPADYRYAPAVEDLRAVYDGVGRTLLCP